MQIEDGYSVVLPRVGVELASYEVRTHGVEQLARRVNPLASRSHPSVQLGVMTASL